MAKTTAETAPVGYDGVLYLEQPHPEQAVEGKESARSCCPAIWVLRKWWPRWLATDGLSLWKQRLAMSQVLRKWPSTMGLNDTWDLSFESYRMSSLQRHVDYSHPPFCRACHGGASSRILAV